MMRVLRTAGFLAMMVAAGGASALGASVAQDTAKTAVSEPRDSVLEARTSAVAAQLRCPVCQGLSIQDSPSELSQSMRAVVREQLKAGKTPDEVKAYFVSKYGEWILLAPKPSGFNILIYAVPVAVVVLGALAILFAVRRWTRGPDEAAQIAETAEANEAAGA